MQIDLPIHKAAGHQELFYREHPLIFHHKGVVFYVKHGNQSMHIDIAFGGTGIKSVALEVVETVQIELAGHQLTHECPWVLMGKNSNGQIQCTVHFLV